MKIAIYGDFTCPFCYLSSRRGDQLAAAGVDVRWRAVEHAPDLPLSGRALNTAQQQAMRDEWRQVLRLRMPGEVLLGYPQPMLANTQAAVAGYAEAVGAEIAGIVRHVLFSAYWIEGQDIGHPRVLRALLAEPIRSGTSPSDPLRHIGYAVTAGRGPVTCAAQHRIREWRSDWTRLGDATLPALQYDGGTVTGIAALHRLAELITTQTRARACTQSAGSPRPGCRTERSDAADASHRL